MEHPNKYQQMQDEMSRFEAEIGTNASVAGFMQPFIATGTYGPIQQRLEAPPMSQFTQPGPMMFPHSPMPAPPMAPPLMIPHQVQFRPAPSFPGHPRPPSLHDFQPMQFMPPVMPGPPMMQGPPPSYQPVVVSAGPQLYNNPKAEVEKPKHENKQKRKDSTSKSQPESEQPGALPPFMPCTQWAGKHKKEKKNRKVVRYAGGQIWEDVTLLEWPEDDFRMFCGDLGNDVTDELLIRTFSKYTSFQRAKVVRDRRTNKSKGFGFVSFKDPGDFIKAMKDMDGRYVGSRPIKLRKSTWKHRSLDVVRKKQKEKQALLSLLTVGKG